LAAIIPGLAFTALPSYALTPPALLISITGASVEIDSTGAQTYTGTCSATACPGVAVAVAGSITWTGTIGTFTITALNGRSKPLLTAPNIDLGVSSITTGATGGTVTISWTDTGFTVGESPATMNIAASGTGSTVFTSYVDSTNAAFGTGTQVGTTTSGGIVTGPGPSKDPFSMTNVEAITLPALVGVNYAPFDTDFSLQVAPTPPLALTCGASTGTVGTAYSSMLVATGGVAPYTYTITAGSISPLLLSSSTGAITGTPTVATTLSFTAQVTDSSGLTGAGTVTAGCSIVVVTQMQKPPALKVQCPSSTATVGVYYSSSVGATGGVPPYTYSVAFGSLPAGLSLNTSTGVVSGTPQTASQTGAFKIEVTDSTGATAFSNCTGSCSSGVTVEFGGNNPQTGWGDKGSNTSKYTSYGLPLNVYGFTTSGSPANLSTTSQWGGPVLGITDSSNTDQIDSGHFVQIDISSLNAAGASGLTICMSQLQAGSTYDVYGSNTKGSLGTLLAGNVEAGLPRPASIPNTSSYKYICIKGHTQSCAIAYLQFTFPCACSIDVSPGKGQCDWWTNSGGSSPKQGHSPDQCGW